MPCKLIVVSFTVGGFEHVEITGCGSLGLPGVSWFGDNRAPFGPSGRLLRPASLPNNRAQLAAVSATMGPPWLSQCVSR